MEERKVKGSMLMDYVRMIRTYKDKDWDKYLKSEDWETINSLILPTKWYPLETYRRCGDAVFNLLAEGNLETARLSGKGRAKELFGNIYKSIVASQDPMRGLNQFVAIYGSLFNFNNLIFEKVEEKHARIHHIYGDQDKGNVAYCHNLMGYFDTLVEMTGGKNVKIELSAKQWEGAPETVFEITWQ